MKRSRTSRITILIISGFLIAAGSWYLYRYLRRWALTKIEREQLKDTERILLSFRSLGFEPSSDLIKSLEEYSKQIQTSMHDRTDVLSKDIDADHKINLLMSVNEKMLRSYMKDLQDYRSHNIAANDPLITFTYDKIVRLTLALAELKRLKGSGIDANEYGKKAERMREITLQSIARGKKTLREFIKLGLLESDTVVQAERTYLTRKVEDLVTINKALYL